MGDGLQTGKASCYVTDDSGQLNSAFYPSGVGKLRLAWLPLLMSGEK